MLPCLVLLPCKVKVWVLYMILFGLGTVPLMSSVVYINSYLTIPIRNRIKKAIPYVAVCIGCLFILRGLGLEFLIFHPI
jgi:sulfite exporter TauE/SafE